VTRDEAKRAVALAALEFVDPTAIIGIGTGSTANHFIDALGALEGGVKGAVASSVASEERLRANGIEVLDLNDVGRVGLYVDGADETDPRGCLIKGGGGALTREKIVAAAADQFVCIADDSKLVDVLGAFPLPVEVIPMARAHVGAALRALGGRPEWRTGFITDNGNVILDVHGMRIADPEGLESEINQITGVVTNGLFARRSADVVLLGGEEGVRRF